MVRAFAIFAYTMMRFALWIGYRMKAIFVNPERKSRRYEGPVIFVGNHISHNDGAVSSTFFFPSRAHILVAKDWYEQKAYNWYLKPNRCIPTDRFETDTTWLREATKVLKNKGTIIMFPEGHTNKEASDPKEFKPGFVMLAMMSGAKIVPFAQLERYNPIIGPRPKFVLGEPMELSSEGRSMKPEYMKAEAERFRQIVIDMKNTYTRKK